MHRKGQGTFISFEGIDGCGKTTQLRLLAEHLREAGLSVVETVEPGGTEIGRQIRRILLDPANAALHSHAELLLYFASRAQNVEEVIRPAIARGDVILCDRFTDSTLVYQGCGRGLPSAPILQLDQLACRGLQPDLTLLIDIDVPTSRERSHRRNVQTSSAETRIDDESAAFHARVREGYVSLAAQWPERIRAVDGTGTIEEVARRVREPVWELVWEEGARLVR